MEETRKAEGAGFAGGAALTRLWSDLTLRLSERALTRVALAGILAVALALRLLNVNWDDGQHLHPDERHLTSVSSTLTVPSSLGEYFDSSSSRLNPYNNDTPSFVYGTLPVFLNKLVSEGLDWASGKPLLDKIVPPGHVTKTSYDQTHLVGRSLAAVFDVGTVLLIFLIGRRLYNSRIALLAALLLALSAFAIQHAHFFVVDPFLTFFTTLTLYFCLRIAREGGWGNYALAGLSLGFATASKVTGVAMAPVIGLAALVHHWPAVVYLGRRLTSWRAVRETDAPQALAPFVRPALALLLAIFVAFLAFRVAQPYAFDAPGWGDLAFWQIRLNDRWVADQRNQNDLLSGDASFPPSVQWIGRASYVHPALNMVLWGMGPALGLAAWGGFLYVLWRTVFKREASHLLPAFWVTIYFLFMGRQFSLYMRYFLPLYGPLALFAAYLLYDVWRAAREGAFGFIGERWPRVRPYVARGLRAGVIAVVALTALWALAYASIYTRPVSRVEASRWINANIPAGSTIIFENWDDALPLSLPGGNSYRTVTMNVVEPDSPQKLAAMLDQLDDADYISISSNRNYDSLTRVPAAYPVMVRYYDALFDERLGFREAATFTSYPGLLGISINDSSSEESFTVYDHPKVLIFEKTPEYSRDAVVDILADGPTQGVTDLTPAEADQNALLLRPADLAEQESGGSWFSLFDAGSVTNRLPVVTWLVMLEAAALALVPLAVLLFRRLPDGGYLLTKPLAILALGYPVWLGASLKLFDFTQGASLGVFALLLVAGAALGYRQRDRLREYWRQHWRLIVFGEALFLLAFVAFYVVRLNNPDIWHAARGGEKPMDFAYLNAITRSTTVPPYDPWFGGGYINYYYFGHFLTANMIKATGILPEVAFNLAVPMFFAAAVGAAFSVGYNLIEASRRTIRRRPGWLHIPAWSAVAGGLLAAFLVTTAGNLKGVDVQVDRLAAVSPWQTDAPVVDSLAATFGGGAKVLFTGTELERYDYWAPSRAILTEPSNNAITEFPYFTFLFADLHAHLMSIPFMVLALGLALAVVLPAGGGESKGEGERWRWYGLIGTVALLGLVVGALRWINSWDYPTFLVVGLGAVVAGQWAVERRFSVPMFWRSAGLAALLAALTFAFFEPFSRNYSLPATGFDGLPDDLPQTPFHQYLSHFGVFLFFTVSLLSFLGFRTARRMGPRRFAVTVVAATIAMFALATLVMAFAGPASKLIPSLTIEKVSAGYFLGDLFRNKIPVAAFALFGLAITAVLLWDEARARRADAPLRLVILGLVATALFLTAAVEVVVLDPDIGRQNTVFKFYLQIWILLGFASAFAAWYLAFALAPRWASLRERGARLIERPSANLLRLAFTVGAAGLIIAVLVYPIEATRWRVRLDDRFPVTGESGELRVAAGGYTNNGLAFMQDAVYQDERGSIALKYDYDAIMWLRENVRGSPIIIEGRAPLYRWGSRISIYTGLPTVLGWDWHQTQQRGRFADQVQKRALDVEVFYTTTDPAKAEEILQQYGVSYVIVGQVERLYYPEAGIAKFEAMAGRSLEPVYSNPQTIIYHVAGTPPPRPALASR